MRSFAPMFGPGFRKPESTRVRARLWMTLEDLITKFVNINATAYVKFVSILGLRDRSLFMDGVGAEEKPRVAEFS